MREYLKLKSRLLRAADPNRIDVSGFRIPLIVDEVLFQRDLLNFRRRYAEQVQGESVQSQDMVTLTCTSGVKRFNKPHITIRIGMGLFSKELENALLGWKVGQTGSVTVKDQAVSVSVENIQREVLPEVDDALAKRCCIPGIETAADILTHCKGKQFDGVLEEAQDEAFAFVSREMLDGSEFELEPDEVDCCQQMMIRQFKESPLFQELGYDATPDEVIREMCGSTKAELMENALLSCTYTIQSAVLGQAMMEQQEALHTSADYVAYLSRRPNAGNKTYAQLTQEYPLTEYLLTEYGDYCMNTLEELTLRMLKADIV